MKNPIIDECKVTNKRTQNVNVQRLASFLDVLTRRLFKIFLRKIRKESFD